MIQYIELYFWYQVMQNLNGLLLNRAMRSNNAKVELVIAYISKRVLSYKMPYKQIIIA